MSNFSVTCRMLSQYLKENRRVGGFGLEMAPRPLINRQQTEVAFRTPAKTMSLFPGVDVSGDDETGAGDDDAADRGVRPEAMDLFPQHAGFGSTAVLAKEEPATTAPGTKEPDTTKGQLTIFYDGRMLVWEDFPADKARYLMERAIKENAAALNHGERAPAPTVPAPPPSANASDMPIARRNSLHRFLEKRKDRVSAKTPYQIRGGSSNAAEPELCKFW